MLLVLQLGFTYFSHMVQCFFPQQVLGMEIMLVMKAIIGHPHVKLMAWHTILSLRIILFFAIIQSVAIVTQSV